MSATRRAGLYVRVSTSDQADTGLSLTVQEAALREAAPRYGCQVAGVYIDAAVSGSVPIGRRPRGSALLADVAAGALDVVMAVRLDRLFRDTVDALTTDRIWREHGCALLLLDLGGLALDTATPMGQMMLTMGSAFAQFERAVITERIVSVTISQQERGIYHSRRPPFGYRREKREYEGRKTSWYVPDDDTSPLLIEVFTRASMGETPNGIARVLTERGIPTPGGSGEAWQPTTVAALLRAPVYSGLAVGGRRTTGPVEMAVNVEPLVPTPLWLAAQDALGASRRLPPRARGPRPLSGLLACGTCGAPLYLSGGPSRPDKPRVYYRCREAMYHGRCEELGMRVGDIMDELEPMLLRRLDPTRMREQRSTATRDAQARQARITDIDRQLARLTAAFTDPLSQMPPEEYSALSGQLRGERVDLAGRDTTAPDAKVLKGLASAATKRSLAERDPDTWRAVLLATVQQIKIAGRHVVSVAWR